MSRLQEIQDGWQGVMGSGTVDYMLDLIARLRYELEDLSGYTNGESQGKAVADLLAETEVE